jgi:hypothetical protein
MMYVVPVVCSLCGYCAPTPNSGGRRNTYCAGVFTGLCACRHVSRLEHNVRDYPTPLRRFLSAWIRIKFCHNHSSPSATPLLPVAYQAPQHEIIRHGMCQCPKRDAIIYGNLCMNSQKPGAHLNHILKIQSVSHKNILRFHSNHQPVNAV